MGRTKRSKANNFMKKKNQLKAASNRKEATPDDEFNDEIDNFHKNRDKITFEDNGSDSEDYENPVFDLKGSESDDEEENGVEGDEAEAVEEAEAMEEDDEDISDDELNSMAAKIEKQAKLLRERRGVIDDEDDEDEEEPEKEKEDWGKRRKAYYAADEAGSSDEEEAALEEAEARRLQQKMAQGLRPEDFMQGDVDDEEETLEQLVEKSEKSSNILPLEDSEALTEKDTNLAPKKPLENNDQIAQTVLGDKLPEKLTKDYSSMTYDEKMEVVKSTAPEMIGLIIELKEGLDELQNVVEPLLEKMKRWQYVTEEGRNYVVMKHQLLIVYCRSIVFYLLLKAEKQSVCDHPVIGRLVEAREMLEKVKVVDQRMKPQVEKFLSLDVDAALERRKVAEDKSSSEALQEPLRSIEALVENKKEEFIGEASKRMLNELARLEEKAKRDQLLEQPEKKGSSGRRKSALNDYEDEVGVENSDKQPKKLSQVINEAGRRQKKPQVVSGDTDLPVKEDLGERRRKREVQVLSKGNEESQDEDVESERASFEDDFYQEAKRVKLAKEAGEAGRNSLQKKETEHETVDGKRLITSEMERNRGLTPYRKKASKNPRKRYKMKHGDAVIRRKGQVRDVRKESGPYGGEATGIRTNLSRSIRFT